ncbi:hypothetical protein QBC43DRAFT_3224 [Cladorrhinum sp. PSN259]|nr:hypothetical protein QBC43DRAFT_3224 [Cladorrhinum sp. PSN259]
MAPIRRYLRITKYSVLEVRIYLDNPSLVHSWLLNPRDPILPKVIEAVRPLVLPKLREERDRERIKKKNKKKAIKDVVTEDEFEVSIFLTETETRHSLLHKQKHFRNKVQTRLVSNSSKLTGHRGEPIDLDDHDAGGDEDGHEPQGDNSEVPILREEDADDGGDHINLADIPAIDETSDLLAAGSSNTRGAKRRRGGAGGNAEDVMEIEDSDDHDDEGGEDGDGLFVGDSEEGDGDRDGPPTKRRKEKEPELAADNDKKKMAMDISYEGFAIYGRVLCLVVKQRGEGGAKGKGKAVGSRVSVGGGGGGGARLEGQAMMENWISSTQIPATEDAGDE